LLILARLAVYIVLGILYEDLIIRHDSLTIPSAGVERCRVDPQHNELNVIR